MKNKIDFDINSIQVKLINFTQNPIPTMYTFIQSTWGDLITDYDNIPESEMMSVVGEALAGKRFAGQVLETVNYTFAISNVSRACTHQLVRTRIGAGYGQQGGRDNDWRHFDFRMPPTIKEGTEIYNVWVDAIARIKKAYSYAVENGIPYQDARFICPIGLETNIVETINLRALSEFVSKRLCNVMQWEINTVALKMRKEVLRVHPFFKPILLPLCEKLGKCIAKPTLFPPCGKYPSTHKGKYSHDAKANGNVILGRVEEGINMLNSIEKRIESANQ